MLIKKLGLFLMLINKSNSSVKLKMVESPTDGGESEINWNGVDGFIFTHWRCHYNPHIFFLI
jgi:hypothetical protein